MVGEQEDKSGNACRSIGKCGIVVTPSYSSSNVRWEEMIGINTGVAMAFGCQKFHDRAEIAKKKKRITLTNYQWLFCKELVFNFTQLTQAQLV